MHSTAALKMPQFKRKTCSKCSMKRFLTFVYYVLRKAKEQITYKFSRNLLVQTKKFTGNEYRHATTKVF